MGGHLAEGRRRLEDALRRDERPTGARAKALLGAVMNEETLTAIRTQLDEAAIAQAWEQGKALTTGEAVALAAGSLD